TEASAIPAGIKASAEWFPTNERGMAGGLFNSSTAIGAMLAPPLVVWAMLTFADSGIGTEIAFVITGGIGVLFAITWFLIYNSPNKHPWITHKELRYLQDCQESYSPGDNKKPAGKDISKKGNLLSFAIT
ncbi:MFS transporter, partial [Salmonella enterica]|uniref:MFS transporter n=1 Tax=Salmonella enterica TaxID=28901 RepID=UPI00398C7872